MGELLLSILEHHNVMEKIIGDDNVNLTNEESKIYDLDRRLPDNKYDILVVYIKLEHKTI